MDDPRAAAFSTSFQAPANLSNATRTGNQITSRWVRSQVADEFFSFALRHQFLGAPNEFRRLDHRDECGRHLISVVHWTTRRRGQEKNDTCLRIRARRIREAGRHRTGAGAHRLRPTDGGSRGGKVRRREVVIPLTQKPPLDPQWRDNAFEMLSMANSQLWLQTLRTGVIWLGPNPSPGSLSHRAHGTFNRSTRHEFRYLPRPSRRTHVTPPSASDTGGDSAAAIDTN